MQSIKQEGLHRDHPPTLDLKSQKFTFKFSPQGCMRSFAVGAAFRFPFSELVARRRVVGRLSRVHASRAALFTDWHVLEKKTIITFTKIVTLTLSEEIRESLLICTEN